MTTGRGRDACVRRAMMNGAWGRLKDCCMTKKTGQRPMSYQPGPKAQVLVRTSHERQRRDPSIRSCWWRDGEWHLGRCPGVAPGWFEDAPLALTEAGITYGRRVVVQDRVPSRCGCEAGRQDCGAHPGKESDSFRRRTGWPGAKPLWRIRCCASFA